jgi:hypothetical protein
VTTQAIVLVSVSVVTGVIVLLIGGGFSVPPQPSMACWPHLLPAGVRPPMSA